MSLELLAAWHDVLSEIGTLGDAMGAAIEHDDVVGAIATAMQLRRARASLARIDAPARLAIAKDELVAIADVAALTLRARGAEATMRAWLGRSLPGEPALLATPLGTAVLADAILPAVWDFETDVVVLAGAALADVATILAELGQRRIVTLGFAAAGAVEIADVDELAVAIRTFTPNAPARFVLRTAAGTDAELAQRAVTTVEQTLSDLRIHRNTVRAFSRVWIEQGAANLAAIARAPSVAAFDTAFAGKPMVIVAPGPSLANNVDQLRALRGRAIITAFSHSLKPVLAAGVVPDLVVTVDPQDVRYHFAGCELGGATLVNAATVHPSLFELPAARHVALSANCAIDDWIFEGLGEQALVPGGGSVATSAFSLALRWGCDPIVFVGLDLSFPGGAYYVETSHDGRARAVVGADGTMHVAGWSDQFTQMKARGGPAAATERAVELPGWAGGRVPSSFMFALFHRWFVERMKSVTATVYNCTEGGAFIDGMRHEPLADVLARLRDPVDVAATLAGVTVDAGARRAQLARHVRGYVVGLRRCRTLARRAHAAIAAGDDAHLRRCERALATALRPLGFASLLAQREVERAHDIAARAGTSAGYLAATTRLLATLETVAGDLEPVLAHALGKLEERDAA